MNKEKDDIRLSKFLSLVLRHKPEEIGILLDENGWTNTQELIEKINQTDLTIDFERLKHIVDTNPKQRFAFDETYKKIRANQGHSVEVELGYTAQKPPTILYHGTAHKSMSSILQSGLEKRSRYQVHLSVNKETAKNVGQRHGMPVIFDVLAEHMFHDGYEFYLSENGVWLIDRVPVKYLRLNAE